LIEDEGFDLPADLGLIGFEELFQIDLVHCAIFPRNSFGLASEAWSMNSLLYPVLWPFSSPRVERRVDVDQSDLARELGQEGRQNILLVPPGDLAGTSGSVATARAVLPI
jgi:hypothetical protein